MTQSANKKRGVCVCFFLSPKHGSGICKQKAEELVIKNLLFKMPEKQSSLLQH